MTDESDGSYPVDPSIELVSSASDAFPESNIDQGLDSASGFGELESNDPVLQTIMQLFIEKVFLTMQALGVLKIPCLKTRYKLWVLQL